MLWQLAKGERYLSSKSKSCSTDVAGQPSGHAWHGAVHSCIALVTDFDQSELDDVSISISCVLPSVAMLNRTRAETLVRMFRVTIDIGPCGRGMLEYPGLIAVSPLHISNDG
jgi:hypothetical protein